MTNPPPSAAYAQKAAFRSRRGLSPLPLFLVFTLCLMPAIRPHSIAASENRSMKPAPAGFFRSANEDDEEPEAEQEAQEALSLTLRGNPSTGYFWSWTAKGDGAVRETGIAYDQQENIPGSPATYTYSFAGEKAGDVVLRFVYSRSKGETPGDKVNTYVLKVLPDKRIVLVDMQEEIVGKPQPQW